MTPNNFRVKNGLTVSNGINVTAGNVVISGGQLVIGATAINATSISGSATAAYTNAVSYTDTKIGTANTAMAANAATAYTNAIAIAANATNLTSGTVPFARLPSLYLGTTAIQSTSAAQAVSGITTLAAGNTTISGFANVTSGLSLSNGTSNFIDWSTAGVQGPSINTRSPGTKLLLYPALSASQTDYAIGISPATIWSTVPGAEDSFKFKWYGADIEVASLSGAGNMVLSGSINAASHTVGTSFVANTSRVVIGTAVGLQANGGIGTAGQVLHSNGTTVYWAADDGITSLVAANGLSGGTITSTGTISVLGGSTLTVNATGVHVNTSNLSIATSQLTGDVALGANTSGNYVATISNANGISGSSSAEGGTPTIGVVTGSTLTVNTTGIHVNSALSIASLALSGDITVSGNLTVSGTRTYVNTTTLDVGDNILTLNADLGASAPSQDAGIEIMRGTSANVQFMWDETNDRWSTNAQPLAVSSLIAAGAASGITTLAAGNTTITGFANVTSSLQVGGGSTFGGTVTLGSVGLSSNGSLGTAGHVLHSNGTATYWAADDNSGGTVTSIATANGLTGGTITTTGTLGVATGSTLTVNTTGIHVNSALAITSLALSGGLSGVTTAAMGNTTITGFANVSVSVNSALFTVGTTVVANTTGTYATHLNAKTEGNLNVNTSTFSNTILVPDTRSVNTTPETVTGPQVRFDFKANATDNLSDGGAFFGEMTFRPYGSGTDWTGGPSHQLGFTANNNLYHRSGTSTTWGAWGRLYKEGTLLTPAANVVMANNNITRPVLTGYTEHEISNTATTGTYTMDCGAANFFDLTLTGNITISPSNVPPATRVWSGSIAAKQDATGGRTITWPTGTKYAGGVAPPATTTANALDIWSLMTYDGGTSWIVSLSVKGVA